MPILNFGVEPVTGRPMVDLYVTMSTNGAEIYRGAGLAVPGPLLVKALVDTGASRSHVDLSILMRLGVPAVAEVDLYTASTGLASLTLDLYVVDLALAGDRPGPLATNLEVIGSDSLAGLKVEMLLGRDVLDGCLLVHDGPNRRFSLAYDPPAARPGA